MSYNKKSKKGYQQKIRRQKLLTKVEKAQKKRPRKRPPSAVAPAVTGKAAPARALPAGKKITLHYKHGKTKVTAKVRYETLKVERLVNTALVADGVVVHKRYLGPKKREAYLDDQGKEHAKADVQTMQVLPDGKMKAITAKRTDEIEITPVDPRVAEEFHPHSTIEVWGDSDSDDDGCREIAWDLKSNNKVGAIKAFSHGKGKFYVGFMKPILHEDGKKFGLDIMLSENRVKRRRWMLTEAGQAAYKRPKIAEPEIPELF